MTNISRSSFLYRNYVLAVGRFDEEVYKCNFFWIAIMYWLFETGTFTERRFIRPILYVLAFINTVICVYVAFVSPQLVLTLIALSVLLLAGTSITLGYVYEEAYSWRNGSLPIGRILTITLGALLGVPLLILYYVAMFIVFLWGKLMETGPMSRFSNWYEELGYSFARTSRRFKYWVTDYTFGIQRTYIGVAIVAIIPGFFIKGSLLVYVAATLLVAAVVIAWNLVVLILKAFLGGVLFCINTVQKMLPKKTEEQIEKERAAYREKISRQLAAEQDKGDPWYQIAWVFIVAWYHNHLCPPVKFVGNVPVSLKKKLKRY